MNGQCARHTETIMQGTVIWPNFGHIGLFRTLITKVCRLISLELLVLHKKVIEGTPHKIILRLFSYLYIIALTRIVFELYAYPLSVRIFSQSVFQKLVCDLLNHEY